MPETMDDLKTALGRAKNVMQTMFGIIQDVETKENTINFLLDSIDEEDLVYFGLCTEEEIDRANAALMSAPEQFE